MSAEAPVAKLPGRPIGLSVPPNADRNLLEVNALLEDPDFDPNAPAHVSPIQRVIGHPDCVRRLLERKADPELRGQYMKISPMQLAAVNGHVETLKVLVDGGANLNPPLNDSMMPPPLHLAAMQGRKRATLFLVESGADCLVIAKRYQPPLEGVASDFARDGRNSEVISIVENAEKEALSRGLQPHPWV